MPTSPHTLDATEQGDALLRHEWLLTNGTGAYSAGTALGVNTRRYHGLLIAATQPPVGRVVLLNQCFEQLVLHAEDAAGQPAEQVIELSSLIFPSDQGEVIVPDGRQRLTRFEKGRSVRWTYAWGPLVVTRELCLHWQQQAATLRYTVAGLHELPAGACERAVLRISPMLTLRDFHATLRKDHAGPIDVQQRVGPRGPAVTVSRHGLAASLGCSAGTFRHDFRGWWYNIHYPIDRRRGQDDCEDHFIPGRFDVPLDAAGANQITLTVALGEQCVAPVMDTKAREKHLRPIIKRLKTQGLEEAPGSTLAQAADDFVVQRTVIGQRLSTILAGYPWFADWGRDTFIALPGLLLTTGRYDEARATLRAFAEAIGTGEHEGLLPNRFDDYNGDAAHYNTVDASLWFVHAALAYLDASGDKASWKQWLAPACLRIVEAYANGTGFGIHMDDDGLIVAGDWNTQLTWMDAAAVPPGSDQLHVFTPRQGKAVEINALWYHALVGLSEVLPKKQKDAAEVCATRAAKAKRAFSKVFWNEDAGCLFDHVYVTEGGDTVRDASIRPNQCLAVSLPHSPLAKAKQKRVMDVVTAKLLTPAGLRTLPEDDADYHPWYAGIQYERDAAYHRGTIWPWLIGPYAEGVLRAGNFSAKAKQEAHEALLPLVEFLQTRGLGQLYEIHQAQPVDGQHPPRGCFAQAWSVAEVLRVWALLHREEKAR
jgi:predicted glycogen debranching enzyme